MTNDLQTQDDELPDVPETGYNALSGIGLHTKTREALEDMAHKGLPLPHAAKLHGMRPDSLERSFKKVHVRHAYNQLVKAIRANAAQSAYMRINDLSLNTKSERLKFDASRWVAGVDGISPVTKVEGTMAHSHSFTGFEYPDLKAKDVTPTDNQSGADDGE